MASICIINYFAVPLLAIEIENKEDIVMSQKGARVKAIRQVFAKPWDPNNRVRK